MNGFKYVRCKTTIYTMDALAKLLNVSKQSIYVWENRKKKIPELRLKQLYELTGVPIKYFLISNLSEKDKLEIKKYRLEKELKLMEKEMM